MHASCILPAESFFAPLNFVARKGPAARQGDAEIGQDILWSWSARMSEDWGVDGVRRRCRRDMSAASTFSRSSNIAITGKSRDIPANSCSSTQISTCASDATWASVAAIASSSSASDCSETASYISCGVFPHGALRSLPSTCVVKMDIESENGRTFDSNSSLHSAVEAPARLRCIISSSCCFLKSLDACFQSHAPSALPAPPVAI